MVRTLFALALVASLSVATVKADPPSGSDKKVGAPVVAAPDFIPGEKEKMVETDLLGNKKIVEKKNYKITINKKIKLAEKLNVQPGSTLLDPSYVEGQLKPAGVATLDGKLLVPTKKDGLVSVTEEFDLLPGTELSGLLIESTNSGVKIVLPPVSPTVYTIPGGAQLTEKDAATVADPKVLLKVLAASKAETDAKSLPPGVNKSEILDALLKSDEFKKATKDLIFGSEEYKALQAKAEETAKALQTLKGEAITADTLAKALKPLSEQLKELKAELSEDGLYAFSCSTPPVTGYIFQNTDGHKYKYVRPAKKEGKFLFEKM